MASMNKDKKKTCKRDLKNTPTTICTLIVRPEHNWLHIKATGFGLPTLSHLHARHMEEYKKQKSTFSRLHDLIPSQ
jgi:hypothetical protein